MCGFWGSLSLSLSLCPICILGAACHTNQLGGLLCGAFWWGEQRKKEKKKERKKGRDLVRFNTRSRWVLSLYTTMAEKETPDNNKSPEKSLKRSFDVAFLTGNTAAEDDEDDKVEPEQDHPRHRDDDREEHEEDDDGDDDQDRKSAFTKVISATTTIQSSPPTSSTSSSSIALQRLVGNERWVSISYLTISPEQEFKVLLLEEHYQTVLTPIYTAGQQQQMRVGQIYDSD